MRVEQMLSKKVAQNDLQFGQLRFKNKQSSLESKSKTKPDSSCCLERVCSLIQRIW
jgi:hypothetical protein